MHYEGIYSGFMFVRQGNRYMVWGGFEDFYSQQDMANAINERITKGDIGKLSPTNRQWIKDHSLFSSKKITRY